MTNFRKVCRLEKILRGNIRFFMIRKKYNQTRLCKEAKIHIPNFNEFMNKNNLPLPGFIQVWYQDPGSNELPYPGPVVGR